jgi:hypothetical protein
MRWGQILVAYIVGSFFGVAQLLAMFKGMTGRVRA